MKSYYFCITSTISCIKSENPKNSKWWYRSSLCVVYFCCYFLRKGLFLCMCASERRFKPHTSPEHVTGSQRPRFSYPIFIRFQLFWGEVYCIMYVFVLKNFPQQAWWKSLSFFPPIHFYSLAFIGAFIRKKMLLF